MNLRKFTVKRIEPLRFLHVKCHAKVIGCARTPRYGTGPSTVLYAQTRQPLHSKPTARAHLAQRSKFTSPAHTLSNNYLSRSSTDHRCEGACAPSAPCAARPCRLPGGVLCSKDCALLPRGAPACRRVRTAGRPSTTQLYAERDVCMCITCACSTMCICKQI